MSDSSTRTEANPRRAMRLKKFRSKTIRLAKAAFPDAEVKIYLTASVEERAQRRYNQLIAKGIGAILPGLLRELKERDDRDRKRCASPLVPATDAHILHTTKLNIDEVVSRVLKLVAESAS